MRLSKLFAFISVCLILAGCADPVVFSEVFQLSKGDRIYTAYNLWYTDPLNMDSLNVQQGSFIPLGTEIEPLATGRWNNEIKFKDLSTGKIHVIKYTPAWRLCTMREFIFNTFTTKNREVLLADLPQDMKNRVVRGEVVPGMSRKATVLSYGPPPAVRTPDMRNDTWIYWRNRNDVIRLIFRNDRVREIINQGHER